MKSSFSHSETLPHISVASIRVHYMFHLFFTFKTMDITKLLSAKSRGVSKLSLQTNSLLPSVDSVEKSLKNGGGIASTFELRWTITGTHLIHNIPRSCSDQITTKVKVAAFDLDGTLVKTKSQAVKFARGPSDWQWFNSITKQTLLDLSTQGYLIVLFTNQGGVVGTKVSKSYLNFIGRVNQIVKQLDSGDSQSDLLDKLYVFASPKKPAKGKGLSPDTLHRAMRKPETGMWQEFVDTLPLTVVIDKDDSFYCGDAAGRPQDFLDSDKKFAENIGIDFKIPEQLFTSDK